MAIDVSSGTNVPDVAVVVDEGRYGTVCRTVLANGLRVITESIPGVRSVSTGVYVGVGSRDESILEAGASHFLEHLLFKGTSRRSALEISAAIEAVGGETNAYTTKEHTCFYARVLDQDLPLAVDVLCDIVTSSLLDPGEIETERDVIIEEIAMRDDEPAEEAQELFDAAAFGDHPLARPAAGSTESVAAMERQTIADFYQRRYGADSIVIAVAGSLRHEHVVELVRQGVARADEPMPSRAIPGAAISMRGGALDVIPVAAGARCVRYKDSEQAHMVIGTAAPHRHDQSRYAFDVLNEVLGGGMSSRLFQEVREKRGLAYAVQSSTSRFADAGLFYVYAGCKPRNVGAVSRLVESELRRIADLGITDEELARGKGMIAGATALGLEDTESRMGRIGLGELLYPEYRSVDAELARISSVGLEDVRTVAAQLMGKPLMMTVVGPVTEKEVM